MKKEYINPEMEVMKMSLPLLNPASFPGNSGTSSGGGTDNPGPNHAPSFGRGRYDEDDFDEEEEEF